MTDIPPVVLDIDPLRIAQVVSVARGGAEVSLSPAGEARVRRARALVDRWVSENRIIYGITTGFGALSETRIPPADTLQLQENILLSHSAGIGRPLPEDAVRAVMAIRVHDLAMGYSGIRLETLRQLMHLLNHRVTPVVPEKGSVGASGDLAPMAHLGLVLLGMGEAVYRSRRIPGREALAAIGLHPLKLAPGEGLALINGTQVMTALATLAVHDALHLMKVADVACAMSLEVLMGSDTEFNPRIH